MNISSIKEAATKKLNSLYRVLLSNSFSLGGFLFIAAGVCIITAQVFLYLYKGEWHEYPILLIAKYVPEQIYSWILYPESWIGLHGIIYWFLDIPVSWLCFLLGYLLFKIGVSYEENLE